MRDDQMGNNIGDKRNLIDYLLGELSEPEREELEQHYFDDNEIFIKLVETEEQLIKDYLDDRLPRGERQLFEKHYLTLPCHQNKVEFARLLNQSEARRLFAGRANVIALPFDTTMQRLLSYVSRLNHPFIKSFATTILIISA